MGGATTFTCKIYLQYLSENIPSNGLRLQANVASAVLTQIKQECTCSVPKVYMHTGVFKPKYTSTAGRNVSAVYTAGTLQFDLGTCTTFC